MLELINVKYMKFLFEIQRKPQNISELARSGDLTLSVASNLISRLALEKVLFKQRTDYGNGKQIIATLTPYGNMQVKLLREMWKNNQQKDYIMENYEKKMADGGEDGRN